MVGAVTVCTQGIFRGQPEGLNVSGGNYTGYTGRALVAADIRISERPCEAQGMG